MISYMIYKRTAESFFILAYLIEIIKVATLPPMEGKVFTVILLV